MLLTNKKVIMYNRIIKGKAGKKDGSEHDNLLPYFNRIGT